MPPIWEILELFGVGVILPLAITAGGVYLARRVGNSRRWAAALVATIALLTALCIPYLIAGIGPLQPTRAPGWEWIPAASIAFGLIAWLSDRLPLAVLSCTGIVVGALLVADRLIDEFPSLGPQRGNWDVFIGLAIAGVFFQVRRGSEQAGPGLIALALTLTCFAAGGVLFLAGIARFAQIAIVLMSCAAGCLLVSRRAWATDILISILPVFSAPLCGLLAAGYLSSSSDVPRWSYLLVGLAPGTLACIARDEPRWTWQAALALGVTVLMLAVALLRAAVA